MRHQSLALAAALTLTLAAAGCVPDSSGIKWAEVAGRDLNCPNDTAELVAPPGKYDIDGDGTDDDFVTLRCTSTEHPNREPSQLEVFRGGTSPDNPTRIAVMVRNTQNQRLTGCVGFAGREAFTRGLDGVVWAARWVEEHEVKHLIGYKSSDQGHVNGCAEPAA